MGFLKSLFGGATESADDKKRNDEARQFDVLKYDGVKAMRMGQMDYAERFFRGALELHDDLEVRDYLSLVLMRKGLLAEALEQLRVLAGAQPDNTQVFIRIANVAFMMEDYAMMDEASQKAMALDGSDAQASYLCARAKKGLGDVVSALAMLTQAISLNDKYGDAYLCRAEMLLDLGDLNGADGDAAWLLEHASTNEDVLLLKARIEKARGSNDEALGYYDKVVEENPFCVTAFRERGALRLTMGDTIGATEDGERVLELEPDEASGVSGDYSAEGIEQKTRAAYRNNPLGLG